MIEAARRNSTTGIKHVNFTGKDGRYVVKKWINGKCLSFGTFPDVASATQVLDKISAYDLNNPDVCERCMDWGVRQGKIARDNADRKAKERHSEPVYGRGFIVSTPSETEKPTVDAKAEKNRAERAEDKKTNDLMQSDLYALLKLVDAYGTPWQLRKVTRSVDSILRQVKKINAKRAKMLEKLK